jgi:hypothetical protein
VHKKSVAIQKYISLETHSTWLRTMAEDDYVFALDLVDDLSDDEIGAKPRIAFWGSNQGLQQGEKLVNVSIAKGSQVIQCGMSHICHGSWVPQGSPATLMVMQFVFLPFGHNRRFKSVEITMTFSRGGDSTVDPEVMALAPEGKYAIWPSKYTEEVSHMINPTIKGTMGLAEASVGYQWQRKSTTEIENNAEVNGISWKKNVASWSLYENPDTEKIPTFLQTAVLLKRQTSSRNPLGEKFTATLKIDAKVDRLAWLEDKLVGSKEKKISRTREKDNALEFDPKVSKGTISGLDNLSKREGQLEEFKKLVTVKEWVDGASKPKDGEVQGSKALSQEAQHQEQKSPVEAELPARNETSMDGNQEAAASSDPFEQLLSHHPESTAPTIEITSQQPALSSKLPKTQLAAIEIPATSTLGAQPLIASVLDPETNMQRTASVTEAQPYPRQPEPRPPMTKPSSTSTDGRLTELLDRLGRVRAEANLLRRLISLEGEERKILQEIMQLEVQSSLSDRFSRG